VTQVGKMMANARFMLKLHLNELERPLLFYRLRLPLPP